MPRKLKVETKTHEITNNFIVVKKENVYIHFESKDDKPKTKNITIHTPKKEQMDELVEKFKLLLTKFDIDIEPLESLKYYYYKKLESLHAGCDWFDMPEYINNEDIFRSPFILICYPVDTSRTKEFMIELGKITNYEIKPSTDSIWYPERLQSLYSQKGLFITEKTVQPKYPIYIISKGRWEKRHTSKYLDSCNVNYKIVVEPQEYENYAKVIDKEKILILPDEYLNKDQGSIPARNFVLSHSRKNGDKRHWILDDNIDGYYRFNRNERTRIKSGVVFTIIEDYVDRYTNIKMAGHNYKMFGVSTNTSLRPIIKNTRIYSSILLSNDIPYEWRGKYNEDTDLSLRILKDGYPTILFNSILTNKLQTMTQKGGNTDTIYASKDAHYLKTKSLYDQHPDVVKITERFGRCHHMVNYIPFKNLKPIMKKGLKLKKDTNNYELILKNDNSQTESIEKTKSTKR